MDFGIAIPPVADSWQLVKRAEELGYVRAWFYDTQMLNSELFVSMTAAALNTSRIRLATGVLIPSNRIAPVAASGLATLNALAPGRIDFGVSTGFTARRTLGLPGVKQADLEEYIRVVRGLLAGEVVDWQVEGKRRKVGFLDPASGAHNLADAIPLHISAFGPRGRRLVARLKAGWIVGVPNPAFGKMVYDDMAVAWAEAGNEPAALHATATLSGCVLEEGEAYDSQRAREQAGPHAMIVLHSGAEMADFGDSHRRPLAPELAPLAERYRAIHQGYQPADARYLSNHRGHMMYLRPEEQEVCTADLMRLTTFTAPRAELVQRVRALKETGYSHVVLNCGYGHPERLDEWMAVFHDV